eukprot:3407832-Rhodomonas_salina.2
MEAQTCGVCPKPGSSTAKFRSPKTSEAQTECRAHEMRGGGGARPQQEERSTGSSVGARKGRAGGRRAKPASVNIEQDAKNGTRAG